MPTKSNRLFSWFRKRVPGRGKSPNSIKDYGSGSGTDSKPTLVVSESACEDSVPPSVNNVTDCLLVPVLSAQPSVHTAPRAPSINRDRASIAPERPITPAPYDEEKNKIQWEKALKIARAKSTLTASEREKLKIGGFPNETVLTALHAAEEARQGRDDRKWKYVNKDGEEVILRDRFDKIVVAIDKYAQTVDLAIQHHPDITSLVWASARFLLQIYLNHKEGLENLEAALNTIITTMANCEFYASIYAGSLEMSLGSDETSNRLADSLEEALPEFYAVVLVFAIKARSYFDPSSRAEQFIRALKPFSSELRPYFTDISEKESRMKELAHMATMEGIKGLRNMHMIIGELKSQLSQITDDHALKWLKATDPAPLFDRNREHRLEGTCGWIMDDENYKSWMAGTGTPNLWVVGIPGAGKSVLSANLVEQVQAMDQVTLLYFFFRDGDNKTTSPLEMAASIVAQLMNTGIERTALMGVVKTSVEAGICFEGGGGRDFKRLWATFVDMLRIYPNKVIVILDAMDECGDCGIVSRSILQQSLREIGVRFLLTGRPEVHHHFHFHPSVSTINMNVNDDISKFITEKVADNENLRRHKDEIIATVYENSAGMFRYAALVLEELNLYSTRKISERLQTMPKGITGMYELILRRLCSNGNDEEMHMRRRILHWVAMAERPFSVAEMQYACATVDGEKSFDPEDVILPSQELILQSCGSLLEIFDGDKLRFTHRTVKEFLLHPPEKLSPDSLQDERLLSCLVTEAETHAAMARTCVTQLFSKRFPLKEAKVSPFGYAVEFWIHHAKKVPQGKNATSVSEDLWKLVADFLWSGSTVFDRWVNVHPTGFMGGDDFWGDNMGPLHVAAAFDLADILGHAHPADVDVNVRDNSGRSTLYWAAYQDAKRAVAVLLEREDVNVNAEDNDGWTSLMVASLNAYKDVVELLLQVKDININAKNNINETALDYAPKDIEKLLLQHGALHARDLPKQGDDTEQSGDQDESEQSAEED